MFKNFLDSHLIVLIISREMLWLGIIFCVLCIPLSIAKDTDKLHIHIIPHSHCDPGWLKTYEEYYTGHVDRILNGVMQQLMSDPQKTFNWAEISFFKLWWEKQGLEQRNRVKQLVENGQFEFIGGGWVQNDEAVASLDVIISQITEGHEYLLKHFGVKPRIAWQIDPFGHSSLTPTLFSQMGYEALVINRIHHQVKSNYKSGRTMEFIWRASPSFKEDADMLTHVLHTHYSAPMGFDWEEYGQSVRITPQGVESRASHLIGVLKDRARSYPTNNLLVAWGDDFKFQDANLQFSNMDQLISHINENSDRYGVTIKYSTVSEYFDAVREYVESTPDFKFAVYHGDFFPYADNEDSYWTGYYSTRPVLKGQHRDTLSLLRSAEMLYAFGRTEAAEFLSSIQWQAYFTQLLEGRWHSSLVAHHDGITGTARARVVEDYLSKLMETRKSSRSVIITMSQLLLAKDSDFPPLTTTPPYLDFSKENTFTMVFHNSLGWTRRQLISVKTTSLALKVHDSFGKEVPIQINPIWEYERGNLKFESEVSAFQLNFMIEVPPLGLATYFISTRTSPSPVSPYLIFTSKPDPAVSRGKYVKKLKPDNEECFIENSFMKINFNQDGLIESVHDKTTQKTTQLKISYYEYPTSRSGAYIFRTDGKQAVPTVTKGELRLHIVKGDIIQEAQLHRTQANTQRIRIYNTDDEILGRIIEVVHSVTPNNPNSEAVVRYTTSIKPSDKREFFTDNGIELRSREASKTRADQNYFPTQTVAIIRDKETQFSVLVKQPQGVTSDAPGSLEIMLHRRLEQDDGRGLSEAVKDGSKPNIEHWLLLDSVERSEVVRQKLSLSLEYPVRTMYAISKMPPEEWINKYHTTFNPLTAELPSNVHVQSIKTRDLASDEVVWRFFHIFESNVHPQLSSTALFDLNSLLAHSKVSALRNVSITLNRDIEEIEKFEYPVDTNNVLHGVGNVKPGSGGSGGQQNSDEEGVFLSQIALENKDSAKGKGKSKSRALLAVEEDATLNIAINPLQIVAFLAQMEPTTEVINNAAKKVGGVFEPRDNTPESPEEEFNPKDMWNERPMPPPNENEWKPEEPEPAQPPKKPPTNRPSRPPAPKPKDSTQTKQKDPLFVNNISSIEVKLLTAVTICGIILIFFVYMKLKHAKRRQKPQKIK